MWPERFGSGDEICVPIRTGGVLTWDNDEQRENLFQDLAHMPVGRLLTLPAGFRIKAIVPDGITSALRLSPWDGWSDAWATDTARSIVVGIRKTGDWSRLAILADAIQDDGCEDAALLGLLRLAGGLGLDMGGWWLVERLTNARAEP